MSYNKYNTRQSTGRYNGRFVPAGQLPSGHQEQQMRFNAPPQDQRQNVQFNSAISQPKPEQSQPSYNNGDFIEVPKQENNQFQDSTSEMDASAADDQAMDNTGSEEPSAEKPHWMKPKLQGVRKLSNKERRRRQNGSLRRLLTPKNALMVLNEIDKGDNTFTVEAVSPAAGQYFKPSVPGSFCAALCSGGNSYKGYGDNKMAARNAAAEQAVRDVLLKKMSAIMGDAGGECEEDLPMIQLASFALYKLFSEWEAQGHRVPQLRPSQVSDTASDSGSVSCGGGAPKARTVRTEVPEGAASMHPCMLLSYMRPGLTYREAGVEGTQPTNIVFTMQVEVDGQVYTGKAGNKREARKAAAREACRAIFGVRFNDDPQ